MKYTHVEWFREDLTKRIALLAEGKIKPVVAERLPLEEIAYAHELLEQGRVQGKLWTAPIRADTEEREVLHKHVIYC
jgi:NADPH:quinone reductase-like Zn-dependent oxidoreductase